MTEHPRPHRPRLTNSAPVLPIDYPPDGQPIWPCPDCYPWHLEVVIEEGEPIVREWHAVDCPVFLDREEETSAAG